LISRKKEIKEASFVRDRSFPALWGFFLWLFLFSGCDQAFYLIETSGVWKPDRAEVEETIKTDLFPSPEARRIGVRACEVRVQQVGTPSRNPWTSEVEAPVQFFLYLELKDGRRFQQNYDAILVREANQGWHLKKIFVYSIRTQVKSIES
jgi:hypothetical protein